MSSMKSFSSVLQNSLRSTAASSELAAKAARANKVKQMWREAVVPVFLDHTNAVYIVREGDEKTLIVYVDDSMFAAELNARRELIKLKFLQKFNEEIEEFKILISRGRYKQNYPIRFTWSLLFGFRFPKRGGRSWRSSVRSFPTNVFANRF